MPLESILRLQAELATYQKVVEDVKEALDEHVIEGHKTALAVERLTLQVAHLSDDIKDIRSDIRQDKLLRLRIICVAMFVWGSSLGVEHFNKLKEIVSWLV